MPDTPADRSVLQFTAQIVSSHVAKNPVPPTAVPDLIQQVYRALANVGQKAVAETRPEPAVPIKKSVFPDYIVCLEDGKKLKMLKRHLMSSYGMTPDTYRERWGLSYDYPMVAPNYAKHRSTLAKSIGLGRTPNKQHAAPEPAAAPDAVKPARRGRKAAPDADPAAGS
jgi:predicted transcriptional regulator